MPAYEFTDLKLAAVHRPDSSLETDANGQKFTQELPGMVDIGVVIDGAFVPITSVKGGHLFSRIEQAQLQLSDSQQSE